MPSLERKLIKAELLQRREEGCDVEEISGRINAALDTDGDDDRYSRLYDELMALPIDDAFPYSEPSTEGVFYPHEAPVQGRRTAQD